MKLTGVAVFASVLLTASLFADGMIFPIEPIPGFGPTYINMVEHSVLAEIQDNVCQVTIDEVFQNPYDREIEGEYIFPIPRGASISGFSMFIGEKEIKGEVLERDEARRIYEDIVRRRMDPALLEYYDQNLFRASVAPIEARGERRVTLRYEQILDRVGEFYEFWYPLKIEGLTKDPIRELSIVVEISQESPIKTVFSPTHESQLGDRKETSLVAAYERNDIRPTQDFLMYVSTSREEFDLSALSHREGDENGYFLLTLSPGVVKERRVIDKDLVFVIDVSGSMEDDGKIESAKSALSYLLGSLESGDRFGLITFSTDVEAFQDRLTSAGPAEISQAKDHVKTLTAAGGTNLHDALLRALEFDRDEARPFYVVFLTDGLPTVGETSEESILEHVEPELRDARMFVFGVGYDVNTRFLDRLADASRGVSEYVRPDENLELVLTDFYGKIAYPALTDLELDYAALDVSKVYPDPLPDLFYGSERVIVGRYRTPGTHTITLEGTKAGETVRFSESLYFVDRGTGNDFVPRLWARRRVAHLLDQIRAHGESDELEDEIVRLGKKYGIVTPYTSFLVTEEEAMATPGLMIDKSSLSATTGGTAFEAARAMGSMKKSNVVVLDSQRELSIRVLEGKTFYLEDGVWTDTEYEEDMGERTLVFGSPAFMDFVKDHPEFAKYLSLGTEMRVILDGVCYRIEEG
jgi:Ca-activated chloride channel family protein